MTEHSLSSENIWVIMYSIFFPQPNIYFCQQLFTHTWIWKVINVKLRNKLGGSFVRWASLRRCVQRPFPRLSDCSFSECLQALWGPWVSPGETGRLHLRYLGPDSRRKDQDTGYWTSYIGFWFSCFPPVFFPCVFLLYFLQSTTLPYFTFQPGLSNFSLKVANFYFM